MQRAASIAIATGILVISGGGSIGPGHSAMAQGVGDQCTDATIRGTYGIQMQGTQPVPPPQGGGTQTLIGVVVRTYHGDGTFSQVDNIKGSVTGIGTGPAGLRNLSGQSRLLRCDAVSAGARHHH